MGFFRRKPRLHLIDLHKYEQQCKRCKRQGIPLRPPPSQFDNLQQATEIYKHYKNA